LSSFNLFKEKEKRLHFVRIEEKSGFYFL